VTCKE